MLEASISELARGKSWRQAAGEGDLFVTYDELSADFKKIIPRQAGARIPRGTALYKVRDGKMGDLIVYKETLTAGDMARIAVKKVVTGDGGNETVQQATAVVSSLGQLGDSMAGELVEKFALACAKQAEDIRYLESMVRSFSQDVEIVIDGRRVNLHVECDPRLREVSVKQSAPVAADGSAVTSVDEANHLRGESYGKLGENSETVVIR